MTVSIDALRGMDFSTGEQPELTGDLRPYDDDAGGTVATVEADLGAYFTEVDRSDRAIAGCRSLDAVGVGHGRPLAAVLVKMIDEYALHAGQAHMLRFAAIDEMRR